jgi:hypothetical protein
LFKRLFNGLVLVVVGAVLLMNTTGYLPWSVWGSAYNYWPLILVGLGLQIALGRQRFPGLAVAVLVVIVLAAMNPSQQRWIPLPGSAGSSKHWSIELKPVTSRLELSLQAPSLDLSVAGDSKLNANQPGTAISGEIAWDRREPDLSSQEVSGTLRASIKSRTQDDSAGRQTWDLSLNPSLATSIDVSGGVSDVSLDTTSVYVDTLNIASGVAKLDLTVGLSGKETRINVTGGVGNVTLSAPQAAGIKITLTGPLSFISDFSKQGLAKVGNYWATPDFESAPTKVTLFMTCGAGKVDLRRN